MRVDSSTSNIPSEGRWLEKLKLAEKAGGVHLDEASLFELIDYIRTLRKIAGLSK